MSAAVAARLLVQIESTADLRFHLVATVRGSAGNSISFQLIVAGTSTAFFCSIVPYEGVDGLGANITVYVATNGSGDAQNIGSLITDLEAVAGFNALVTITEPIGPLIAPAENFDATFLSGGADASGLGSYAF